MKKSARKRRSLFPDLVSATVWWGWWRPALLVHRRRVGRDGVTLRARYRSREHCELTTVVAERSQLLLPVRAAGGCGGRSPLPHTCVARECDASVRPLTPCALSLRAMALCCGCHALALTRSRSSALRGKLIGCGAYAPISHFDSRAQRAISKCYLACFRLTTPDVLDGYFVDVGKTCVNQQPFLHQ